MIQALYHRDRTGQGQKVDTSIIYAHLFNTSYVYTRVDGQPVERNHLDGMQLGFSPRYRIYETGDGWLALAAVTDDHWSAVGRALGVRADAVVAEVEAAFLTRPASEWFGVLDGAGVPCEVSANTFVMGMFDDEDFKRRGWVTSYTQPHVGHLDMVGLTVDFSDTPGRVAGPPVFVGYETREIMLAAGFTEAEVDDLVEAKVLLDTKQPVAPG